MGSLSLSAAAANTAWKTRQSSLLSSWLAQCDDVTSRDIIIILINTVTHHQDFRVGGVRGSHKIGRQSEADNPCPSYRNKVKNLKSHATVNELLTDRQGHDGSGQNEVTESN